MKRFFRRLILRRQLATVNAHLNWLQGERETLARTERAALRRANELQLALLNLEIRARNHA